MRIDRLLICAAVSAFLLWWLLTVYACNQPGKQQEPLKFTVGLDTSVKVLHTSVEGNADWKRLQGGIDSCIANNIKDYYIGPGQYTINKTLINAKWDGTQYKQVEVSLHGSAMMGDMGRTSVIRATFNDAPILAIQQGRGIVVSGINFQGPGADGRDSRYSPQAAIAIDPFRDILPPDSGYPTLRAYYRGPQVRSGSSRIRVEDCTFGNVVCGFITSPNGYTQNAEIITLQNIWLQAVKYGIVGCQAQEKENRVINLGAWGPTNCVFVFNKYGAQQPGNWYVDGVNIAGSVDSIIARSSSGWGQMTMAHVFAESIKTIGFWEGGSGDVFSESLINLKKPNELGYYPDASASCRYLTFRDMNIRYYGQTTTPMLLQWAGSVSGGAPYLPPVVGQYAWETNPAYTLTRAFYETSDTVIGNRIQVKVKATAAAKDHILFGKDADHHFVGQGEVESVIDGVATIRYISNSIKSMRNVSIWVYKKK